MLRLREQYKIGCGRMGEVEIIVVAAAAAEGE
jgi:hypothetical protein